MRTPVDVALMNEWEASPDVEQFSKELFPKLKLTQEISKQNLADSNVRATSFYDRGTIDAKFALGSKVMLHNTVTKKGECHNLKKTLARSIFGCAS